MRLSYMDLKIMCQTKSYAFFESGPYDVNLYGIRTRRTDVVDEFNDILGIAFTDEFGNQINWMSKGTTKPGIYWLGDLRKGNVNGTFIVAPGQHRRCWRLADHKGYRSLVQSGPGVFKGWRDNDMDGKFDYHGDIYTDVTGLNMHRNSAIKDRDRVGAYSAGCQVRQSKNEHEAAIEILERSEEFHGELFSYTLFEDHDFLPKTQNV